MLVLSGGSLDAERATCFSAGRRQGVARRASNFLSLRRKKVTKERATLLCVSLRCATGNLRCSVRGCAAELTARCALRSNNCGESVHEVRVSCGTRTHPLPCASRHAQKGTRNRTSPQAIAALGLDCAAQGACAREDRSERSDGPYGCWVVRLPTPSVCAWGAQEAGWRGCAAGHTGASSTDSPRLSERSATGAQ